MSDHIDAQQPLFDLFSEPKPVQLKFNVPGFWGPSDTAVPTEVTKTNIFNVGMFKGNVRDVYAKHVPFFSSLKAVECFYKGPALDQRDADVWIACLSIWNLNPGQFNEVEVRIGEIAKKLGMPASGKGYDMIRASIDRLYRSNVKYVTELVNPESGKLEKLVKEFHLISGLEYMYVDSSGGTIVNTSKGGVEEHVINEDEHEIANEDDSLEDDNVPTLLRSGANKFKFMIDPNMQNLFKHVSWTDFDKRKMLSSQTAKAIEFYAIGHTRGQPHYITYESLAQICGRTYSSRASKFKFRTAVKQAMEELSMVKIMMSYQLKENSVEWVVDKDLKKPVDLDRKTIKESLKENRKKNLTWNNVTHDDIEEFYRFKMNDGNEAHYNILLDSRSKQSLAPDVGLIKRQIILDWLKMGKCEFVDLMIRDAELNAPREKTK